MANDTEFRAVAGAEASDGAWRPHDALQALRARLEAGYTMPGQREQLQSDMTELLEFARTAADLLAQVHGWVQTFDEGDCDNDFALREIRGLVEVWE